MAAPKLSDLELQLRGYRLTTAEIVYRMPDHLSLFQQFLWQDLDIAPAFPVLKKFLDFWQSNLDGPIHKVIVANRELIKPAEFRVYGHELNLH